MRPVLVVEGLVLAQQPQQVRDVPDQRAIGRLCTQGAEPALHDGFMRGARTALRFTSIPASARTSSNAAQNDASRSCIRNIAASRWLALSARVGRLAQCPRLSLVIRLDVIRAGIICLRLGLWWLRACSRSVNGQV